MLAVGFDPSAHRSAARDTDGMASAHVVPCRPLRASTPGDLAVGSFTSRTQRGRASRTAPHGVLVLCARTVWSINLGPRRTGWERLGSIANDRSHGWVDRPPLHRQAGVNDCRQAGALPEGSAGSVGVDPGLQGLLLVGRAEGDQHVADLGTALAAGWWTNDPSGRRMARTMTPQAARIPESSIERSASRLPSVTRSSERVDLEAVVVHRLADEVSHVGLDHERGHAGPPDLVGVDHPVRPRGLQLLDRRGRLVGPADDVQLRPGIVRALMVTKRLSASVSRAVTRPRARSMPATWSTASSVASPRTVASSVTSWIDLALRSMITTVLAVALDGGGDGLADLAEAADDDVVGHLVDVPLHADPPEVGGETALR